MYKVKNTKYIEVLHKKAAWGSYLGYGLKKATKYILPTVALGGIGYAGFNYAGPYFASITPKSPTSVIMSTKQDVKDHVNNRGNLTPQQKKTKLQAIDRKLNDDGSFKIPLYKQVWNWMKANPGWTAAIAGGLIGLPLLVAAFAANNNDQDQQE